jgi:hypothetical protein
MPRDPYDPNRRHRGLSISFDLAEERWVDTLVDLLREEGFPRAGRSEVVRLGLLQLREALAGKTRQQIVRFFVRRDADRLSAALDYGQRLPFDRDDPGHE